MANYLCPSCRETFKVPYPHRGRKDKCSKCGEMIDIPGKKRVRDYTRELEDNPQDPEIFVNRGREYVAMRQLDRAIEDCSKAIELSPDFAEAYNCRGYAYYLGKKYSHAAKDYARALSISPEKYDDSRKSYKEVSLALVETEIDGVRAEGIRSNTAFDMHVIITHPYQNFAKSSHIAYFARGVCKFRGDYAAGSGRGLLASVYKTCLFFEKNLPELREKVKELDEEKEKLKGEGLTDEQFREKRRYLRKKRSEGEIDDKEYQNELRKFRKLRDKVNGEMGCLELVFSMENLPGAARELDFIRKGRIKNGYFEYDAHKIP